jgi:hypothetical protein
MLSLAPGQFPRIARQQGHKRGLESGLSSQRHQSCQIKVECSKKYISERKKFKNSEDLEIEQIQKRDNRWAKLIIWPTSFGKLVAQTSLPASLPIGGVPALRFAFNFACLLNLGFR